MAVGQARNVYSLVGSLCINPTNLALAFPHGGTAIGLTRQGVFKINPRYEEITSEEAGGPPVEFIRTGEAAVLAAVLREFDPDALPAIFPNTKTGASSGKPVVVGQFSATSGTPVKAGALASDKAVKLLFSPRATDYHPAVIIYNAIPLLEKTAELQLALGLEAGIAVVFQATPRSSDFLLYQVGLLEDLSL